MSRIPPNGWPSRIRRGLPCSIALVLLVWSGLVTAAEPSLQLEPRADLGLSDTDRAPFEEAIAQAARKGMEEAGVTPAVDATARLSVVISWADDQQIDFKGHIEVQPVPTSDQAPTEAWAIRGFDCQMCGTDELLDRVRSEVALALGTVDWAAHAPPEPEPDAAAEETTDGADDEPARDRPRLRALGWIGVGTLSLGVVATGTGAFLWTREDRIELRPTDPEGPVWAKTLRPPGIALVAVGATAIVAGASMIIVDAVRGRRSAVAVVPAIGPRMTGLALEGSF